MALTRGRRALWSGRQGASSPSVSGPTSLYPFPRKCARRARHMQKTIAAPRSVLQISGTSRMG